MRHDRPLLIDILCKVVDNFGDIGVVYRLARALSDLEPGLRLRIVVDNLESFRALCPEVDPGRSLQTVRGWTVADWAGPAEVRAAFATEPPGLVVEAFACGRPDWFEELLFDPGRPENRLIVNLEYLSAEDYADDFHLMGSLTRSSEVKKRFFMPGFTAATGGLILDRPFMEARDTRSTPGGKARLREELARAIGAEPALARPGVFWLPVFSYERDYRRIVADLAAFARDNLAPRGRPLLALAAAGKSQACFLEAWEGAKKPFPALALPFLPQETWDRLLLASEFAIVRGEDSLSRAALSGQPFLWQAYPQDQRHQLVKATAFLERVRPFLAPGPFQDLEAATLALNDRDADAAGTAGGERLLPLLKACLPPSTDAIAPLPAGFRAFSEALVAHGNLALPLLGLFRDFL